MTDVNDKDANNHDWASDIAKLPAVGVSLQQANIRANKKLGQHFLIDEQITQRIVKSALPFDESHIVEIGPGGGALTRVLLSQKPTHLTVIEADDRFIPLLKPLAFIARGRMDIINGDALLFDMNEIKGPIKIIANLPYNIATALIIDWLTKYDHIEDMILMVQKEVAVRMTARPNQSNYGRLSVLVNYCSSCEQLFSLPPSSFSPPPKVDSSVIRLLPHATRPNADDLDFLQKITAAAFGQRRKMLRQSLRSLNCDVSMLLQKANIDGTRRAETLTLGEFIALQRALKGE